jgi:Protein of unknown function (DUF4232)
MADRRGTSRSAAAPLVAIALALGLVACTQAPAAIPTGAPTVESTPAPTLVPTASAPPATVRPTATETEPANVAACTKADLKASHGLVEGAAGSRLTTLVLVAATTCSVDLYPALGLRDANGGELVGSASGGPGRIDLEPNASYQSDVRLANWCGPDPAFPLALELRLGAEEVTVTGSSFPEEGDMPPCNGGAGPVLEAGAWEPAP